MLIEAGNAVINIDHVVSIEEARGPDGVSRKSVVTLASGQVLHVPDLTEKFRRLTGHIIPAPAGYVAVIGHMPKDDEAWFEERPILAFRYEGFGGFPLDVITDESDASDEPHFAIRRSDGHCISFDRDYDSVDHFKAVTLAAKERAEAEAV